MIQDEFVGYSAYGKQVGLQQILCAGVFSKHGSFQIEFQIHARPNGCSKSIAAIGERYTVMKKLVLLIRKY